jgi:hypothetical protein
VPVYQKPSVKRRRKTPGAKTGHPGARRKTPERIDVCVEHRLAVCPCCGGPVQRCKRTRTRIIKDIPKEIAPVVTEHTIHRDYCPACKKGCQLSLQMPPPIIEPNATTLQVPDLPPRPCPLQAIIELSTAAPSTVGG